jgi:hypothetical protein
MNQFPSVRFIKALCNGAKESPGTALGLVACMSVTLFATNVFTGELLLSTLAAAIDPVDTRLSSLFALK